MEDMKYATEDVDLRSRMGDVACAIQALPAVSRWSQIHNRHIISPKPTGFNVTLRCYKSEQHGDCGKQQEPSRRTDPRCLPPWRCLAAGSSRNTVVIVQKQRKLWNLQTRLYRLSNQHIGLVELQRNC